MRNRSPDYLQTGVLTAILALSVVAMVLHFREYWWKRDRLLYVGRTVTEQRMALLQKVGIDPEPVLAIAQAASGWPNNTYYRIISKGLEAAYATYLLAPRVPNIGSNYFIRVDGSNVQATPQLPPMAEKKARLPGLAGLIISVLLLAGAGFIVLRPLCLSVTLPECVGMGATLLATLTVLSKMTMETAIPGMTATALVGAVGCGWWLAARWRRTWPPPACLGSINAIGMIAVAAIGLAFLMSLLSAVTVVPDDWDAWATWGPKAKVLLLGHGPLSDVMPFGGVYDYPLLWPSVWGFSGFCSLGWEEQISRAWGPILFFLTAWEITVFAWRQTGRPHIALLWAALFATVPYASRMASTSYAEAPLWLFIICSARYVFELRWTPSACGALAAGLFAAGAALTKNEGLLFAVLAGIWVIGRVPRRLLALQFLPLLALYGPWSWWCRVHMHLGNYHLAFIQDETTTLAGVLQKIPEACRLIGALWSEYFYWGGMSAGVAVLTIWIMARKRGDALRDLAVPGLMMLVFFATMIVHPQMAWLIDTTWYRLTIQLLVALLPVLMVHLHAPPGANEHPESACTIIK